MPDTINNNFRSFATKSWKPLTEIRDGDKDISTENTINAAPNHNADKSADIKVLPPSLQEVSPVLIKLLWDILVYLFSSVSVRIKRLGLSARAFERAKHEGLEKGFIVESTAGQTTYLIPTLKTFEAYNMPCSYQRSVSIEHSFYVGLGSFLLKKDPAFKSVETEVKRGSSGATSDIVTTAHNGTRQAYEVTLNTTNVLSNASKYEATDFIKINFLCRNYKLREAVKACCREGGLDPKLLARLDYVHFSQLLQRQRRLSLY